MYCHCVMVRGIYGNQEEGNYNLTFDNAFLTVKINLKLKSIIFPLNLIWIRMGLSLIVSLECSHCYKGHLVPIRHQLLPLTKEMFDHLLCISLWNNFKNCQMSILDLAVDFSNHDHSHRCLMSFLRTRGNDRYVPE